MRRLFLALLISVFLINIASAETELFRVDIPSNLQFTCTINDAVPSSSATFNISVYYPNGTVFINNTETTAQGQGSFEHETTFVETGLYKVKMFCYDTPFNFSDTGFYDVSPIGKELTTPKIISYVLIFAFSIFIFIGLLVLGFRLEGENSKDMTGYIIAVSNIKYLKLFFLGFSYVIFLFINYFGWMLSHAYLDMPFVTNIFRFIFTFQAIATLPLFLLFTYLTIANLVRDSKVKDALTRGLRVK